MMGVLQDWRIIDVYRERVFEAIEFQYTDWPDPENRSARAQEFINVSCVPVLVFVAHSVGKDCENERLVFLEENSNLLPQLGSINEFCL